MRERPVRNSSCGEGQRSAGEREHAGCTDHPAAQSPRPGPQPHRMGGGTCSSSRGRPSARAGELAGAPSHWGWRGAEGPRGRGPEASGGLWLVTQLGRFLGSQALPHVCYHFTPPKQRGKDSISEAESQAWVGWAATPESQGAGGAPALHPAACRHLSQAPGAPARLSSRLSSSMFRAYPLLHTSAPAGPPTWKCFILPTLFLVSILSRPSPTVGTVFLPSTSFHIRCIYLSVTLPLTLPSSPAL